MALTVERWHEILTRPLNYSDSFLMKKQWDAPEWTQSTEAPSSRYNPLEWSDKVKLKFLSVWVSLEPCCKKAGQWAEGPTVHSCFESSEKQIFNQITTQRKGLKITIVQNSSEKLGNDFYIYCQLPKDKKWVMIFKCMCVRHLTNNAALSFLRISCGSSGKFMLQML